MCYSMHCFFRLGDSWCLFSRLRRRCRRAEAYGVACRVRIESLFGRVQHGCVHRYVLIRLLVVERDVLSGLRAR